MFKGYLHLSGATQGIQVFFDEKIENTDDYKQFFIFGRKDEKTNKERFICVNPNKIVYIEYWEEEI